MSRSMKTLKYGALGLFVLLAAAMIIYDYLYLTPSRKCEAGGGWWSNRYRTCSSPVVLEKLTGRKSGQQPDSSKNQPTNTPKPQ